MKQKVSFSFTYSESEYCYSCGLVFKPHEKKFKGNLNVYRHTDKHGSVHEKVSAECICKNCHMVDVAHIEAKEESRRVTEICIGSEDSQMGYTYGIRCLCGRSTLVSKDACLLCESERRMIKLVEAETKLFRRMLSDLNKQIKETTKQNTERTI